MINEYEEKDKLGRDLFNLNFNGKFSKIQEMPIESKHDLEATGQTGVIYTIEIKVRNNSSTDYYSTTIIEEGKIDHFKSIMKYDNKRVCLYAVFYDDDIVTVYNMSERIKEAKQPQFSYKLNTHKSKYRNNNSDNSSDKFKFVLDLSYKQEYGDKQLSINKF